MTLITTAVLGTFLAGTVLAAENNDFYTRDPDDRNAFAYPTVIYILFPSE